MTKTKNENDNKDENENDDENNEIILNIGYELEAGIKPKHFITGYDEIGHAKINPKFKDFENLLTKMGFILSQDGSVSTEYTDIEIKSKVYKDIKNKEDLKQLLEDFKKFQDAIAEINDTCGLHIHISFKDFENYFLICNFDFCDKFIKEYEKNFKKSSEKERIENHFCAKYQDENDFKRHVRVQLASNFKNGRYKAVNYNAFNLYKTIEFRIFKAVDNDEDFKRYLYFLYDFIIDYLKENKKTQKKEIITKKRKLKKNEIEKEILIISENEFNDENFNMNQVLSHPITPTLDAFLNANNRSINDFEEDDNDEDNDENEEEIF